MMPFTRQKSEATLIYIIALTLLICMSAPAQTPQQQQAAPSSTEELRLNVIVLDKEKRAVADVRQDELQILEDGKPQTISSFAKDTRPLRLMLVVDTSGSLRTEFKTVLEAARSIINSQTATDEISLVRFVSSDTIQVAQDFTSDKKPLLEALNSFRIEGGQSAVIDAVYLSATKIAAQQSAKPYRSALILITDGEDRGSFYKQDALLKLLRETDVQVFPLGLVRELEKEGGMIMKSPRARAEELLTKLAEETGGRVFFPESSKELPSAIDELMSSLRTQFVVGYTRAPNPKSKPYRKLKATISDAPGRSKRTAITPAGYLAPHD